MDILFYTFSRLFMIRKVNFRRFRRVYGVLFEDIKRLRVLRSSVPIVSLNLHKHIQYGIHNIHKHSYKHVYELKTTVKITV